MSDRSEDRGRDGRTTDISPASESALDPTGTQDELDRGARGHPGAAVADRGGDRAESRREIRGEQEDAPVLESARLGGLEGLGLLTVVRDASGELVDANGSWREPEPTLSFAELQARLPAGTATTYEGPMVNRQFDGAPEQVRLNVVVTRHGEYEDYDGNVIRMVNFVAHELD